jgi:hypothetical protein
MMTKPAKRVRCAVYTRVSTEHGLDQEFNSLDAQNEAEPSSGRKSDPTCPRFDVRLALSSSPGGASCRLQAMKNCLAEYVLT